MPKTKPKKEKQNSVFIRPNEEELTLIRKLKRITGQKTASKALLCSGRQLLRAIDQLEKAQKTFEKIDQEMFKKIIDNARDSSHDIRNFRFFLNKT